MKCLIRVSLVRESPLNGLVGALCLTPAFRLPGSAGGDALRSEATGKGEAGGAAERNSNQVEEYAMSRRAAVLMIDYPGKAADRFLRGTNRGGRKVAERVRAIVEDVRVRGDTAVCEYTRRFDGYRLTRGMMRLGDEEIGRAADKASRELTVALGKAATRIRAYHRRQMPRSYRMKTDEGTLQRVIRPLRRVGVYIPGGYTAYPSTILMDVIPARIAGVKEIAAVTPVKETLDPGVAAALRMLGVKEVYRIGGAQAVAALALGTSTVKAVDKIVGPGNAYVSEAKRTVYGDVDIDMVAGPSEVVIVADERADPAWVALDMLAQAEHGTGEETAVCITESRETARKVGEHLAAEIRRSPVRQVLEKLRKGALAIIVTPDRASSIRLVNRIAPEHLQLMTSSARRDMAGVRNAGAIFVGRHSPVALGDYFIGTNHVLPTGTAARFASALGVEDFLKRIPVAEASAAGLRKAAPHVAVLARAEGFIHHALSVERRVKSR